MRLSPCHPEPVEGRPTTNITFTVVVPTYHRVPDLTRCLTALEAQQRAPDRVLVVYRESDEVTRDYLASAHFAFPLDVITVQPPGQVAALNAALAHVTTDIIAITDDDAAPRPDWLARVEQHYLADPTAGGVGGRDHVAGCPDPANARVVGRLQWFGRTVGGHHLGTGPARYVDFLKGANMTFRRAAIETLRFDERLRGAGAQVCNDLAFSLTLRRRGWKLIYDPAVAVDHFPAERFDDDRRGHRPLRAVADLAFNETLTLLEHLPWPRRAAYLAWAIAVGKRDAPGVVQCIRLRRLGPSGLAELIAVVRNRLMASAVARPPSASAARHALRSPRLERHADPR